ncbi:MAG: lipid-A-disaccharide synthase [Acidobacteria bacterium]|nr:lipid-A-disaccharide synthase [Acidobacteriota bacterium]MBV9925799.1 lipid-A-disaccharide synthase [Acidobacteriota bacterium]
MSEQVAESFRLMLVAGEESGDAHAAALARALREAEPGARFELFGSTGAAMARAGVESVVREEDLAITGLVEIARALPRFWAAYRALKRAAVERRPDAVVLVDWPDFNLALARALRRRGLRVIYYISPQLWAWRSHRVRQVRRDVDLLLTILPFEREWYAARGVEHVEFVGHPLAGSVTPRLTREEFCARHNLNPSRPIVALLPGSRRKEFERILPVMLDAAALISWRDNPEVQFVVALASRRSPAEVDDLTKWRCVGSGMPNVLRVVEGEAREALAAADAAAVCSGTATLEAALTGTPLVVVYKESALNWQTLGRLIEVEHYGLVNLVAGYRLAPELMQDDFTGDTLARELTALLDPEKNRDVRARLREAAARLGEGGASRRAAEAVLAALRRWKEERTGG